MTKVTIGRFLQVSSFWIVQRIARVGLAASAFVVALASSFLVGVPTSATAGPITP